MGTESFKSTYIPSYSSSNGKLKFLSNPKGIGVMFAC